MMNSSTGKQVGTCDWVLLCEMAQGLIEAKILAKQQILIVLKEQAPNEAALKWAASRLTSCVSPITLRNFLGEPWNINKVRAVNTQAALVAEFILGCRYSHTGFFHAIEGHLLDLKNCKSSFGQLWELLDTRANSLDMLNVLNAQLPNIFENTTILYPVALSLMRRIYSWPLFYLPKAPSPHADNSSVMQTRVFQFGLSFPLSIRIIPPQKEQKLPWTQIILGEKVFNFPQHNYGINTLPSFCSLLKSVHAAQATWRSNHGRVVVSYRNVMEDYNFEFNFHPSILAFRLLSDSRFPETITLEMLFEKMLSRPQQSLEAYIAQAVMAQALARCFGARTAATGSLLSPTRQNKKYPSARNSLSWAVQWPENAREEQLIDGIFSKALHAGSSGAYERMVIPANPPNVFRRLRNYRININRHHYIPHFIPVGTLAKLLDVSITGLWRNQRFVRCEHLAEGYYGVNQNESTQQRKHWKLEPTISQLSNLLRHSKKNCIYITTNAPEFIMQALSSWFLQLNRSYLKSQMAPTQMGTLMFKAIDYEVSLPFLASLYHAMAGQLDGKALHRIESLGTLSEARFELAEWFNHRYSEAEPWQAPDITIFYGIENIRQHSKKKVFGSETWFDAMGLLLEMHNHLLSISEIGDHRHEEDLGKTRLIIVDNLESEQDVPNLLAKSWLHVSLNIDEKSYNAIKPIEYKIGALEILRTVAPAATVVSVQRVLDQIVLAEAEVNKEKLPRSLPEPFVRLLDDVENGRILNFNGLYGLWPEQRGLYHQNLPAHLFWRAHVAAAASYAPWLQLHKLIPEVSIALSASDEWLLPERLSEISYHLNCARNHVPRKETDAFAKLTSALITVSHIQHHTHPARLRLLRRFKNRADVYNEWERINAEEDLNTSERYQILAIGAFMLLEQSHTRNSNDELTQKIEALLTQLHHISRTANALSKIWMGGVEKLIHMYLDCYMDKTISSEVIVNLHKNLQKCYEKGMTINDAASAFESIGDYFCAKQDMQNAQEIYRLGVLLCTRHSVFCMVKSSLLSGTLDTLPIDLLSRAERRFKKLPSHIPWLCESISINVISLMPRKALLTVKAEVDSEAG